MALWLAHGMHWKKQPPTHKREYLLQQFNESQYIE